MIKGVIAATRHNTDGLYTDGHNKNLNIVRTSRQDFMVSKPHAAACDTPWICQHW